jgi:hypothetical protein
MPTEYKKVLTKMFAKDETSENYQRGN